MTMKLFLVYKNSDMTEGNGPMVVHSIWLSEKNANEFIDKQRGVMGRLPDIKWSEWPERYGYGGDWQVKPIETED